MQYYLIIFLFSALAYLIGSVSTAIIICKLMGLQDPRTVGSNNPGATNVLRHGGKKAAFITLLGDMLKGLIPVLLVMQFQNDSLTVALVGLCALLGHIFPLYYGFKGGKGVATFYGVILGTNWLVGVIAITIWLSVAFVFKISSLSAMVSIFFTPFILWHFSHSVELTATVVLMSMLILWRHRSNIKSLMHGAEETIGQAKD
ncbi:MAG: glycerol-3-phosphate 1-O-acyltransferase PlsY [Gammaproteobacteria bacterium]|nr:glycerol-3-phosphate 1-O-acyltransferase PlsY [Gammaproteobacteria bacterium]